MNNQPNEGLRAIVSRPVDVQRFVPESSTLAVEIGAASVCGKLSSQNTDHYLAIRLTRLQQTLLTSLAAADLPPRFEEYSYALLVADGIAGNTGARASRVALTTLAHLAIQYGKWNVRVDPDTSRDIFAQGQFLYARVHDAVRNASRADGRLASMATSLTALYIAEDNLFFAHVGHSAAFLFRDGVLTQLTNDHTEQPSARASRLSDGVTRTIGGRRDMPHVDTEHIKLLTGDRLLLCTNGLTDVVTPDAIADTLASRRRPMEDCARLIDLAVEHDGADDVTAVLADYTVEHAAELPPKDNPDVPSPEAETE